jgi:uncharacterized membrane protein
MQTEKQHVSKFSVTQMSKYWYIGMLCLGLVACKQIEPAPLSPKVALSFKLDGQSVTLDSLWVKETYTLGNTKIFYLVAQRYDKQTLSQELRIVLPAFKSKDVLTLPNYSNSFSNVYWREWAANSNSEYQVQNDASKTSNFTFSVSRYDSLSLEANFKGVLNLSALQA